MYQVFILLIVKSNSFSRSRLGKPAHRKVRENPNSSDHSCENRDIFPDAHVREPVAKMSDQRRDKKEQGFVSRMGGHSQSLDMK